MYDVQPVEEEAGMWIVPPFSGEIVSMEPFGKCLVSRGAINTKAPLRAFFNACQSILKVKGKGKLPVNLIFVIEGEEEIGSLHLLQFVNQHQKQLARADAAFFPEATQNPKGKVIMELGVKGIIYMDLICQGGEWGGQPTGDTLSQRRLGGQPRLATPLGFDLHESSRQEDTHRGLL